MEGLRVASIYPEELVIIITTDASQIPHKPRSLDAFSSEENLLRFVLLDIVTQNRHREKFFWRKCKFIVKFLISRQSVAIKNLPRIPNSKGLVKPIV